MGLAIVDNTMTPADRAFRLRNASMQRRFYLPAEDLTAVGGSVGTEWTKLLFGFTCAFNVSESLIVHDQALGTGVFGFGIQSGITASDSFFLGGKHGIGIYAPHSGSAGFKIDASGTPEVARYPFGLYVFRHRNAVSDNSGSLAGAASLHISVRPNTYRSMILWQAFKTGGNLEFKFAGLINFANLPELDTSDDELIDVLTNLSDITDINTYGKYSGKYSNNGYTFTGALADQDTYGYFDSCWLAYSGNTDKVQMDIFTTRFRVLA